MSVIPAFQRIGAPDVAALEQAGPKTIAVLGLAASFVAAVWPPSALHPSSSTFSLMGWPTSVPPWSLIAISDAALLVDAERRIGSGHYPIGADLDRCTLGDHKNAEIISNGPLGFCGCHGRRAKRGQRGAKRGQQTLAVFHRRSSLLNLRAQFNNQNRIWDMVVRPPDHTAPSIRQYGVTDVTGVTSGISFLIVD